VDMTASRVTSARASGGSIPDLAQEQDGRRSCRPVVGDDESS
jgi:hypothetical protein